MITAVAGLDNDAFAVDTTVDDQGVLEVGEQSFANWYYTQYGRTEGLISVVRAISRSNDIFFYRAAEWTGVEALAQKARDFGFGERTGVELPGEQAGLVPDPAWKEETFGERWFLGNTFHLGIGQGDLLSTPLQLAQMMTVFGNNGTMCHPRVVASDSRTQAAANCGGVGVDEETLAVVQEGMIGACSGGGTAFPFFAWNDTRLANLSEDLSPANQIREGVVACKTGTAEFGGADERGFRRTHALFGMTVGGLHDLLVLDNPELETELAQDEASAAATVSDSATEQAADLTELRQQWFAAASRENFPDAIVILVLVESDEEQPYAEGSREAAPVARDVFGWLVGENQ